MRVGFLPASNKPDIEVKIIKPFVLCIVAYDNIILVYHCGNKASECLVECRNPTRDE